jgi:hypothetical protein
MKKPSIEVIIVILGLLAIAVLLGMAFLGDSYKYILIDGDDIIEYEIVDGDTIIIHTEDEQYKVQLFDEVVDFTVSSNITIELVRECILGKPLSDGYRINRIIKTPNIGGIE